jgi:N-acetyl-anhydromuramyl-L-alanine amidase AmpD
MLHEHGIGAWYDDDAMVRYRYQFSAGLPDIVDIQSALRTYGYDIDVTGAYDVQTEFVIRAFQMHFRPSAYTGAIDAETVAILYALNDKYWAPTAN